MSLIHPHRNGFNSGINNYSDTLEKTGMDFDILVLNENDKSTEFLKKSIYLSKWMLIFHMIQRTYQK